MKNKPVLAALAAAFAISSGVVQAGHDGRYGDNIFPDRAKVVDTAPVYERINEPRRECWTEQQRHEHREYYRNDNNSGGAILGAIVGGLVGSTVGKGNGKVAAAAVGAATGAVIGDRWNDRDGGYDYVERPVERCRMVDNYRQQLVGYDVTYRYQGREFTTRLPYDPGEWLSLSVSFTVADEPRGRRWNEGRNQWNQY